MLADTPPDRRPVLVEEFSRRHTDTQPSGVLGRRLLRALVDAADGDPFLRGGHPRSETLLLLAIKMHDLEATLPELLAGRTVVEGRSAHTVAVYQSLILEPDDRRAADLAHQILATTARWRPLPDLTILVVDDVDAAVRRAETRDAITYSPEQWRLHRRAATLFDHLATADPEHVRTVDRRVQDTDTVVALLSDWIADPPRRTWEHPPPTGPW